MCVLTVDALITRDPHYALDGTVDGGELDPVLSQSVQCFLCLDGSADPAESSQLSQSHFKRRWMPGYDLRWSNIGNPDALMRYIPSSSPHESTKAPF